MVRRMIVIEKRDQLVHYKSAELGSDWTNLDHIFVSNFQGRLATAFFKGLLGSVGLVAVSGFSLCPENYFLCAFILFISVAFAVNEYFEQRLAGTKLDSFESTRPVLSSVNPAFAAVPIVLLLSTMNVQTLILGFGTAMEVLGIACGVPLLLYGSIKLKEEKRLARVHVYVGSASTIGGIALSVVVNIALSNISDMSIFSATNYFSNAIEATYAPDVVLSFEK